MPWIAVFKNSSGGELDRIEAENQEQLREQLVDKLDSDYWMDL